MSKKLFFACENCAYESPKWLGRCPSCSMWNTFRQVAKEQPAATGRVNQAGTAVPLNLEDSEATDEQRLETDWPEVNRLFGGGLVPGSLILLGGEPGAGKSTFLLQMADQLAVRYGKVLYVSAEESLTQVKMRARRLGLNAPQLFLYAEEEVENIIAEAERLNPVALIIDSVQTVKGADTTGFPGSPAQVREVVQALLGFVKGRGMICFLVGHITKSGLLAGPKLIEHMVDVVLSFEGDRRFAYRVLRVAKNRFGSTQEIVLLNLGEKGLTPVQNPSAFLLAERRPGQSGTVVVPIIEGSLPLLVEIQALVTIGNPGNPRRLVSGLDHQRVAMVLAVLERRGGLPLSSREVYVSVIGGVRTDEPACDLAIALAVVSSFYDWPLPPDLAAFGEIGLTGEVRRVGGGQRRLEEARNHGFRHLVIPQGLSRELVGDKTLKVQGVGNIQELLAVLKKKEGE